MIPSKLAHFRQVKYDGDRWQLQNQKLLIIYLSLLNIRFSRDVFQNRFPKCKFTYFRVFHDERGFQTYILIDFGVKLRKSMAQLFDFIDRNGLDCRPVLLAVGSPGAWKEAVSFLDELESQTRLPNPVIEIAEFQTRFPVEVAISSSPDFSINTTPNPVIEAIATKLSNSLITSKPSNETLNVQLEQQIKRYPAIRDAIQEISKTSRDNDQDKVVWLYGNFPPSEKSLFTNLCEILEYNVAITSEVSDEIFDEKVSDKSSWIIDLNGCQDIEGNYIEIERRLQKWQKIRDARFHDKRLVIIIFSFTRPRFLCFSLNISFMFGELRHNVSEQGSITVEQTRFGDGSITVEQPQSEGTITVEQTDGSITVEQTRFGDGTITVEQPQSEGTITVEQPQSEGSVTVEQTRSEGSVTVEQTRSEGIASNQSQKSEHTESSGETVIREFYPWERDLVNKIWSSRLDLCWTIWVYDVAGTEDKSGFASFIQSREDRKSAVRTSTNDLKSIQHMDWIIFDLTFLDRQPVLHENLDLILKDIYKYRRENKGRGPSYIFLANSYQDSYTPLRMELYSINPDHRTLDTIIV